MPSRVKLPYRIHNKRLKPMLDIAIAGPTRVQMFPAILDSGADLCVFHTQCAADVGLTLDGGRRIPITYGGSVADAVLLRDVRIFVGQHSVTADIAFAEKLILGYGLLGRSGFFDRFYAVGFFEHGSAATLWYPR